MKKISFMEVGRRRARSVQQKVTITKGGFGCSKVIQRALNSAIDIFQWNGKAESEREAKC